jgi:hypothetical protein
MRSVLLLTERILVAPKKLRKGAPIAAADDLMSTWHMLRRERKRK